MIRTFLDANVLVSAGQGNRRDAEAALLILQQSDRIFLASPFLRLEVLPHAHREKQWVSVKLYEQYFARAESCDNLEAILQGADEQMLRTALGLADALHISAAALLGADEFITGEGTNKPIYRNTLVKVVRFFV